MSAQEQALRERAWGETLRPLFSSSAPDRHVFLDDVLTPAALDTIRSDLLGSWAWNYRSQPGYVLCLAPPEERWDRSPETSGISFFPLARPAGMPNRREYTLKYFEEKSVPRGAYVPYRENRAFIFPASTFHSIGPCDFDASASDRMRCSVSIFLDDKGHWEAQRQLEQSTRESVTHEF
jgi:hypothetical protein